MLENNPILALALIFSLAYLVKKVVAYQGKIREVHNWPGFRTLLPDRLMPIRVRWISPGRQWTFYQKYEDYASAGTDVLASICIFPPSITFYVADPALAKEVVGARARFPKPAYAYELLNMYGSNIISAEGEEWKQQRKTTAPAFSEKNNRLVWDETINVLEDLFQNVWCDQEVIELDHVVDVTVKIALHVIGAAGFGRRMSWIDDNVAPPGHSLTFKEALHEVSYRLILHAIFPDWILRNGTRKMRYFHHACGELGQHLREMVEARRTARVKEEGHDLFSNLLDANELEDGEAKLSDSKLLGNLFVFFVAGYETTAHALAYAFILLALYPDEQEAFYRNLKTVMPSGRNPTYEEFGSLSYSLAVLNETLRLFPPVINIPKVSAEDTTFTTTNSAGEKVRVPVPRGSFVTITTASMHTNPRYWEDPHTFKPARFLGNYPRDAFLPFSGGPRGCIGRGFAETEGVAVLSTIIARYKVEVRDEPQFAGETFEQRKARLLKSQQSVTIYPERAPLVFRRR
ncbi:cytochrome P450 [Daedaleopsis nitida]|nr:cytochrome P450 [Daedaleopsis nitida]